MPQNGSSGSGKARHQTGLLLQRSCFMFYLWGKLWAGCCIECYCDNMAVVSVINSSWAKDKALMHLLRCMFFMAARLDIHIHASHIPGVENTAADALSRNCLYLSAGSPRGRPPNDTDPSSPGGHDGPRSLIGHHCAGLNYSATSVGRPSPNHPESILSRQKEIPAILPEDLNCLTCNRAKTCCLCI